MPVTITLAWRCFASTGFMPVGRQLAATCNPWGLGSPPVSYRWKQRFSHPVLCADHDQAQLDCKPG